MYTSRCHKPIDQFSDDPYYSVESPVLIKMSCHIWHEKINKEISIIVVLVITVNFLKTEKITKILAVE